MKKITVIILALVLIVSCAACGRRSSGTESTVPQTTETDESSTATEETTKPQKTTAATKATTSATTEETTEVSSETMSEEESTLPETEAETKNDSESGSENKDQDENSGSEDSGSGDGNSSASAGYSIDVNLSYSCVTIYYDGSPVRAMRASVGAPGTETITGTFYTSDKGSWGYMEGNVYAKYFTRFSGPYLFHSVPYYSQYSGDLEYGEYNKLGSPASLGCVRLCVADALWIYNNIPYGTKVHVFYDGSSPGPLGKPGGYWVPEDIPQLRGWDPTDPSSDNAWRSYSVNIKAPDVSIKAGSDGGVFSKVSVTDCYGNNVEDYASYSGDYDLSTPGTYTAYVSVAIGGYFEDSASFTVTVTGTPKEETTPEETTEKETPAPEEEPTTKEQTTEEPTTTEESTTPEEPTTPEDEPEPEPSSEAGTD